MHKHAKQIMSAIGMSNFSEKKVEEILACAEIKPAVDQV